MPAAAQLSRAGRIRAGGFADFTLLAVLQSSESESRVAGRLFTDAVLTGMMVTAAARIRKIGNEIGPGRPLPSWDVLPA